MARPRSIIKVLEKARSKAIMAGAANKNDINRKLLWRHVSERIQTQLELYRRRREETTPSKKIFVSYSKATGAFYYSYLEEKLKHEKFEVVTGFMDIRDSRGLVLRQVLNQLKASSVYVGILTNENNGVPSVWTIEEKAFALALEKPIELMVEDGVQEDFWRKTVPEKRHQMFSQETFMSDASIVVERVLRRWEELALEAAL